MNAPFTGRHMAAILVAGFGVVIAVNLVMARLAVTTFGGVVVENSYVASQEFNTWLDAADRAKALGWEPHATRSSDDRVAIAFTGPSSLPSELTAVARHPLGRLPDKRLSFTRTGPGRFVSAEKLAAGRWTLRLEGRGGASEWRGETPLQ